MPHKLRIHLADDYADILRGLKRILEREGFAVETFENGEDLMLALTEAGHQVPCDIVVTDNDMPLMTGVEALAAIRADPKLRRLPVIVFTGNDTVAGRVKELGGIYAEKGSVAPLLDILASLKRRLVA